LGRNALYANTTGAINTAVSEALTNNTTGSSNVGVGYQALRFNTTSSNNTAVGYQAGYSHVSSDGNNVFVGQLTGYSTTGRRNTFIGAGAGYNSSSGQANTIIGRYNGNQGGLDIRTSNNNIVLADGDGTPFAHAQKATGTYANYKWTFGGNNITAVTGWAETVVIGQSANANGYSLAITSQDYAVRFGHQSSATALDGVVGSIRLTASATSYNTSSDYRLKENVIYDWDATTRLKQLRPARFNFIIDPDTTVDGFLAHEAQTVVPEAVKGTKDATKVDENNETVPEYQEIDQSKLVPLLVKTIQELEARITALENA